MPGLVAILAEPGQPGLAEALDACLKPLVLESHVVTRLVAPEIGFAMGQTAAAYFAPAQPGFAAGDQIAALVEGEPISPEELAPASDRASLTPAEMFAELYAARGSDALTQFEGHWALAVLDRQARRVVIANDAFGVRPLYQMGMGDGSLVIASHPAALLAHPAAQRALSPSGLADYLAFSYILGDKTLFEGLTLLPPATLLTWDGEHTTHRSYWSPKPSPAVTVDLEELEAIRQRFNQRVANLAAINGDFCLALTGGLDSRTILSAMMAAGLRPAAMTHTVANAGDARAAAQLAEIAGIPHHFYEVRGKDLPSHLTAGVTLFGGQVANIDVHPLCFLDSLTRFTQVMFTGMGGDVIQMNYGVVQGMQRATSMAELANRTVAQHNRIFDLATDFPVLFNPEWYAALRAIPGASVAAAFAAIPGDVPAEERSGVFYLRERIRKFLTKGDTLVRRDLETRHPFMTRDILMAGWNLPMPARAAGLVHAYIITRNAPALAEVPLEVSGEPIRFALADDAGRRQRLAGLQRRIKRWGQPRYVRAPNYRYAEWIRGPLRPQITDLLTDPRTQARPYFDQKTVQRWLQEHMAGRDHTPKLAALFALETTIRAMIEQDVD